MIRALSTLVRTVRAALFGSAAERLEARHYLFSTVASRFSLHLYSPYVVWPDDAEFLDVWRRFPEATPGIKDRRFLLFSAARSVRAVAGDTAECGVFRGAGSHLILESQKGTRKAHHLFDSFEGLSEPSSTLDASGGLGVPRHPKYHFHAGEDVVRANLAAFENVHYHRGWIPERFAGVADRRFSVVHIDLDLYEPTRSSLEFFYPRMTPGGMIICDDYGVASWPGVTRAIDEFFRDRPEKPIHVPTGQALIVRS